MTTIKPILLLLGLVSLCRADAPTTQPTNDRAAVGERLLEAVASPTTAGQTLRDAVLRAAGDLPEGSRHRETLMTMGKGEIARESVEQIAKDIMFTPKIEAPTPEGWPTFTPVGEVELKSYPKYRMAYVDRGDTPRGGEFFTLFFHIQRNQIAMTGPVEMEMAGEKSPQMTRMAFLYQNTDIGAPGKDRLVTVVDVAPMEAVSIGVRGNYRGASMREARALLDAWLKAHPEYESAGELRVLGYNSPSVPVDKRYAEIQIPVKRR